MPIKSIAIIAMGPSGIGYLSDYGHGEKVADEVWGINHAGLWYPGVDMIIAMDDMKRDMRIDKKYVQALRKSPIPKMTSDVHYDNCLEYPIDEILEMLPEGVMLDNTCTFALALAILRKAKQIRLYGYDFHSRDRPEALLQADREWRSTLDDPPNWFSYHNKMVVHNRWAQEPGLISTTWMAGYATGKGIDVWVCPASVFLDTDRVWKVHGYDDFSVRSLRID